MKESKFKKLEERLSKWYGTDIKVHEVHEGRVTQIVISENNEPKRITFNNILHNPSRNN